MNLHRKFARRCDDDGPGRVSPGRVGTRRVSPGRIGARRIELRGVRISQQPVEESDEKGGRLTGAGLSLTRDIAPGEGHRQSLRLNGGAARIAEVSDAPFQGFGDVEGFERELTEMGV